MNELQIFNNSEFGSVRTLEENGKPLFCAKDIALALGYENATKAVRDHCKPDGGLKRYPIIDSLGRNQEAIFISEGDVYRLIASSKLPGAQRFETWVFDEVLPSIRKNGAYLTPDKLAEVLLSPDTMIQLCQTLKAEQEQRKALETQNAVLLQENAEMQHKSDYVDAILQSEETLTTSQIAADYGLSARRLNQILREKKIQRNVNGQWILYSEQMGKGYTKSHTIKITHSDGRPGSIMETRWTQKGRLMINTLLNRCGIYANVDILMDA